MDNTQPNNQPISTPQPATPAAAPQQPMGQSVPPMQKSNKMVWMGAGLVVMIALLGTGYFYFMGLSTPTPATNTQSYQSQPTTPPQPSPTPTVTIDANAINNVDTGGNASSDFSDVTKDVSSL